MAYYRASQCPFVIVFERKGPAPTAPVAPVAASAPAPKREAKAAPVRASRTTSVGAPLVMGVAVVEEDAGSASEAGSDDGVDSYRIISRDSQATAATAATVTNTAAEPPAQRLTRPPAAQTAPVPATGAQQTAPQPAAKAAKPATTAAPTPLTAQTSAIHLAYAKSPFAKLGGSRPRFRLANHSVSGKGPYGFALEPGTLVVNYVTGKAEESGIQVNDELISVAGVEVTPTDWRQVFISSPRPFTCVFLSEDPSAAPRQPVAQQQPQQQQGVSAEAPRADALLSVLEAGWGAIVDAKNVFGGASSEADTINPLAVTKQRASMQHLVGRIQKMAAAAAQYMVGGGSDSAQAGDKSSAKSPSEVKWTPQTTVTELVQKLSDTLSGLQANASDAIRTVDACADAVASATGHVQGASLGNTLSRAGGQLASQLVSLDEVRRALFALESTGLAGAVGSLAGGDSKHDQRAAVQRLLAESVSALKKRASQIGGQIQAAGVQMRSIATEGSNAGTGSGFGSKLAKMGRKSISLIQENKSAIQGGIQLLVSTGIVGAKTGRAASAGLALATQAGDPKDLLGNPKDLALRVVDQMLEQLVQLLPSVRIPDIEGNSQGDAYWYRVSNLSLRGLRISKEQISVFRVGRTGVRVQISDAQMHMTGVGWAFRQLSWPKLQSDGTANADAKGVWIRIELKLKDPASPAKASDPPAGDDAKAEVDDAGAGSSSSWGLELSSCRVTITSLSLSLTSGAGSWLANKIIWLFSERIRTYITSSIKVALETKMTSILESLNSMVGIGSSLVSGSGARLAVTAQGADENRAKEGGTAQ